MSEINPHLNIPESSFKKPLTGRRIFCDDAQKMHYEQAKLADFVFADYSWPCKACGGTHCSECWYETDGETITVKDCGRFKN